MKKQVFNHVSHLEMNRSGVGIFPPKTISATVLSFSPRFAAPMTTRASGKRLFFVSLRFSAQVKDL